MTSTASFIVQRLILTPQLSSFENRSYFSTLLGIPFCYIAKLHGNYYLCGVGFVRDSTLPLPWRTPDAEPDSYYIHMGLTGFDSGFES